MSKNVQDRINFLRENVKGIKADIEAADGMAEQWQLHTIENNEQEIKTLMEDGRFRQKPYVETQPLKVDRAVVNQPCSTGNHASEKERGLKVFTTAKQAKGFHTFLRAVAGDRRAEAMYEAEFGQSIYSGQTEESNSGGGYLVPQQLSADIIAVLKQYGVFRRNAKVIPMTSDTLLIPKRTTGLTSYYTGEASNITTSTKTWAQVELKLKKLAALAVFSNELSEDAIISVADDLAAEMAYSIAIAEDTAGFVGLGGADHGHIVGLSKALQEAAGNPTNTSAAGVKVATGNLFSEVVIGDIIGVAGLVTTAALDNAKWYCSPKFFTTVICHLISAAGGSTYRDMQAKIGRAFLGYPVELVEVMPSTDANSQVALIFGDLAMSSTMGIKQQVRIERSDSATVDGVNLFQSDQQGIRMVSRYDIVNHSVGADSEATPVACLQMLNG